MVGLKGWRTLGSKPNGGMFNRGQSFTVNLSHLYATFRKLVGWSMVGLKGRRTLGSKPMAECATRDEVPP